MQNPSYTSAEIADRSVQVLERVVFEKDLAESVGIERLIVVNQFAFIQTKDFVGTKNQVVERNKRAIEKSINESDIVLIAWGKDNGFIERQSEILEMVRTKKEISLLQTSRHPSRVVYNGFIQPFHI